MSMIFEVNSEGLGVFVLTDAEAAERQAQQLHDLIVEGGRRDGNLKKVVRGIKSMISKDPLFLRGYAVLGELLQRAEGGDEDEAEAIYVKGCRAALKLLPDDFLAPMDLENAEVQCFLRCHTGYIESLMAKKEYAAALAAARRQLAFDPEDQFDRGRELGELAVMAGELRQAEAILLEQIDSRPTAWYSLAYLSFLAGDFPATAVRLRRGFLLAPYVGGFLSGQMMAPNFFWDQGPRPSGHDEEFWYANTLGGDMWAANQEASDFLIWLSQTGRVLAERAALVTVAEECFARGGPDQTAENAFQDLWTAVDERSSELLTRPVVDPETCEELPPWTLLSRYHERLAREEAEEFEGEEPNGDDEDGETDADDDR